MNEIRGNLSSVHKTLSVVIAVYAKDRADWFCLAVDSIMNQTLQSDDIVIVRDGPVGDEIETALCFYEKLSSVRIVRLEKGVGAGEARNVGIRLARNEIVAIMDADDIAVADRFELQLVQFNRAPMPTIVGGQIAEFEDVPNRVLSYRNVPLTHAGIIKFSKRRSPFNNMTVCFVKRAVIEVGGYRKITRAEDYNLWLELLSRGNLAINLPQVLCSVRVNRDALLRRISWEHTSELLKMRYAFLQRHYIGALDFIIGSAANLAMFALPKRMTRVIYGKVLRR